MTPPTELLTIRQIRAQAKKVLAAAHIQYATSHTTRIRGWHSWTHGVHIEERWIPGVLAEVCASYDIGSVRERDLREGVAALRAAGWTVSDDGLITAVPA